jgi:hypothetical protein
MIEHGASKPHEHEVIGHGGHDGGPPLGIEVGTVGWEDDQIISDLNTDPNDGITLIRVQLFRGRQATKPVTPGIAQGIKILAQLSGPLWNVPARGQRVFVAIPHGMESTPGAAVIMAMPGPAPNIQYGVNKTKMDLGPNQDLVIKARSIALTTYSNQFISITSSETPGAPDQIVIQDHDGTGITIEDGVITIHDGTGSSVFQISETTVSVSCAGSATSPPTCLLMSSAHCQVVSPDFICNTGGVYLGYDPTFTMTLATSGAVYCGPSTPSPTAATHPLSYLVGAAPGMPCVGATGPPTSPAAGTAFAGISSKVFIAP